MSSTKIYEHRKRRARIMRVAVAREAAAAANRETLERLDADIEVTARPSDAPSSAGGAWVGTQIPKGLR